MSFMQQISNRFWVVWLAATMGVFGFGRGVSASGQTPAPPLPPAPQQAATTPPGSVTRLSIDDAVRLALENNLGIQSERLGPEIGTLAVAQARTVLPPDV